MWNYWCMMSCGNLLSEVHNIISRNKTCVTKFFCTRVITRNCIHSIYNLFKGTNKWGKKCQFCARILTLREMLKYLFLIIFLVYWVILIHLDAWCLKRWMKSFQMIFRKVKFKHLLNCMLIKYEASDLICSCKFIIIYLL